MFNRKIADSGFKGFNNQNPTEKLDKIIEAYNCSILH